MPALKEKASKDPRNAKHDLAHTLVRMYHSKDAADAARQHFEQTIINKQVPDDAPTFTVNAGEEIRLLDIIAETGFSPSNGETKRMVKQGGISLNDEKIQDMNFVFTLEKDEEAILKVGKRNYGILKGE